MLVYLLAGVIAFPLIAIALWGYGGVLALVGASIGASAVAGTTALVLNHRRTRRRQSAAQPIGKPRTTLAD